MPPEAACSSMLTEFLRKLLEVEPGPLSAAKEALTASTITVIRAGSWTPAATTGAETVDQKMIVAPSLLQKRATKEQTTRPAEGYLMANSPCPN